MRVRTIQKIDWHGAMALLKKRPSLFGMATAKKKYLPKAFKAIGRFKHCKEKFERKKRMEKPFGDNYIPPPPVYKELASLEKMIREIKVFPSSYDIYSWIGKL